MQGRVHTLRDPKTILNHNLNTLDAAAVLLRPSYRSISIRSTVQDYAVLSNKFMLECQACSSAPASRRSAAARCPATELRASTAASSSVYAPSDCPPASSCLQACRGGGMSAGATRPAAVAWPWPQQVRDSQQGQRGRQASRLGMFQHCHLVVSAAVSSQHQRVGDAAALLLQLSEI